MSAKYFAHDTINNETEYFATLAAALVCASEMIETYKEEGWPEEIFDSGIVVGIITHVSIMTNQKPVPLDEEGNKTHPEWDYFCDVEMAEIV